MTLVERLWRFNELPDGVGRSREEKGYLAIALGEMGEERARAPIEAALKGAKWPEDSATATEAMVIGLVKLGAVESLPTLLQVAEDCTGERVVHGVGRLACLALATSIKGMPAERRQAMAAKSRGKKQAVREALVNPKQSLSRTRLGRSTPFDFRLDAASLAELTRRPRPPRDDKPRRDR